jgi:hypothetical protein
MTPPRMKNFNSYDENLIKNKVPKIRFHLN